MHVAAIQCSRFIEVVHNGHSIRMYVAATSVPHSGDLHATLGLKFESELKGHYSRLEDRRTGARSMK